MENESYKGLIATEVEEARNKCEAVLTNGIPVCPYCNKPTKRQEVIIHVLSGIVFPQVTGREYDEHGYEIISPKKISDWSCLSCNGHYELWDGTGGQFVKKVK